MKTKLLFCAFYLGAIFFELIDFILKEKDQFVAIFAVVFLDLILGSAIAIKNENFKTHKSFKSLFMLGAFWMLLATVLTIEKAFTFVPFLSESILLPILLFEIISILKNMELLGLISSELLSNILSKIDKHKDV